ncbi:hypothetical protein LF817_19110 [Halobacillus sp. A1]|uniref:hypothetical protein n=1 Tax=Halobacillus sp. A1 TaxID=2880262 RepID=UPI0020A6A8AD|nr:hypothetical protein [Halobacillus sp. A1]MCP3033438.1 hypothetical protein [Halobacillus sp. A1]
MDSKVLIRLVKKDLLQRVWFKIDRLVSEVENSTRTQFGERITGNHSWFSGASTGGEDIQLSSLIRIFEQISTHTEKDIRFEDIFTEEILHRAKLLNYLSATKEENSYLHEIIGNYMNTFKEIKTSLAPLYREEKLGDANLQLGYEKLAEILEEMESGNLG